MAHIHQTYLFQTSDSLKLLNDLHSTLYAHFIKLVSITNLIHNFFIPESHLLHYIPRHVSSIDVLIFRRNENCMPTVSGIVTLCKLH